jgi:hypothetical protein
MKRTVISVVIGVLLLACAAGGVSLAQDKPAAPAGVEAKTLRAYLIGNSLTFGAFPNEGAAKFMDARGHRFVYGSDICWGQSIGYIWDRPTTGSTTANAFGYYGNALSESGWDAIAMQPYAAALEGEAGDVAAVQRFIAFAQKKNPDVQFYIYETWPYKPKEGFDFATQWMREYPLDKGVKEGGCHSRDYCAKLVAQVRAAQPGMKKPLLVIPAGDMLYELDQRMKAGKVPGFANAGELYADSIHLNDAGNYAVRCVFFATLYGENPKGLAAAPDAKPPVSDELAAIFQDAAWAVVSQHALAGVKKGKSEE